MNKKEFKDAFLELFNSKVTVNKKELEDNDKIKEIRDMLVEIEIDNLTDTSNKGKGWTDEELKVILSFSPTKENCIKLAKAFKRGYGSIEQIFRWAATSDTDIEASGRKDDKFIMQIKRIYKELGWRA